MWQRVLVLTMAAGGLASCTSHVSASAGRRASLLQAMSGTWDWTGKPETCRDNPQTIEFVDDGRSMMLKYVHAIDGGELGRTDKVRYEVRTYGKTWIRVFIVDPPEKRRDDAGNLVVWDLFLIDKKELRWHRTDWKPGVATRALTRCEGK
jgi:hypothetical protein